jgi:hypothetical protein
MSYTCHTLHTNCVSYHTRDLCVFHTGFRVSTNKIHFYVLGKSRGNWHINKIFFLVFKIVAITLGVSIFYWSKMI